MGDDFLVQKLPSCLFYVSNHNHVLRRFLPYFFRYAFPLNSDDFSVMAFFYSCILCLFYCTFTAYFVIIFPWYFPEKSGTFCSIFRHISMNFSCLIFFVEMSLLVVRFISLIYSFIYSLLFVYLFVYFLILFRYFCFLSFKLFSCSYLFIYFLIHVFC